VRSACNGHVRRGKGGTATPKVWSELVMKERFLPGRHRKKKGAGVEFRRSYHRRKGEKGKTRLSAVLTARKKRRRPARCQRKGRPRFAPRSSREEGLSATTSLLFAHRRPRGKGEKRRNPLYFLRTSAEKNCFEFLDLQPLGKGSKFPVT